MSSNHYCSKITNCYMYISTCIPMNFLTLVLENDVLCRAYKRQLEITHNFTYLYVCTLAAYTLLLYSYITTVCM